MTKWSHRPTDLINVLVRQVLQIARHDVPAFETRVSEQVSVQFVTVQFVTHVTTDVKMCWLVRSGDSRDVCCVVLQPMLPKRR